MCGEFNNAHLSLPESITQTNFTYGVKIIWSPSRNTYFKILINMPILLYSEFSKEDIQVKEGIYKLLKYYIF